MSFDNYPPTSSIVANMQLLVHLPVLLITLITTSAAELYKLKVFSLEAGHPVGGADINASGRAFYPGLAAPATYCPGVVGANCPNNTVGGTVFSGLMGLRVCVFAHV
jgi:hypothetical protein